MRLDRTAPEDPVDIASRLFEGTKPPLPRFAGPPSIPPQAPMGDALSAMRSTSHWGVVSSDPLPVFADVFQGFMQLHGELVAEKDQTLALTRGLMERQQELAELHSYVRLLEQRLAEATARRPDVEGWR